MDVLLDTSVAVELMDGSPEIVEKRRSSHATAFMSVISHVELIAGLYRNGQSDPVVRERLDQLLNAVEALAFTGREADAYDRIIAAKGFSRRVVVDRMIAATALANGLAVATLNPRDFRDIPGLTIEDWSA